MSGDEQAPAPFTEDDVAVDFVDAIDREIVGQIGYGSGLRHYKYPEDDNDQYGEWPFVVVRDGREFEVDIDVRVTELTPERKARREAQHRELLARIEQVERYQRSKVGES